MGILLALRQAPEIAHQGEFLLYDIIAPLNASPEKRVKRPRLSSPSSTPSTPNRIATPPVSVVVPPRASQVPPLQLAVPFSRDPKARRGALAPQLPLLPGRKVAFHQPPSKSAPLHTKGDHGGAEGDGDTWILAVVKKCINQDKNRFAETPRRH